ncbi:hypothetical protein WMF37_18730 [Sorangium sp. So ce291]|uniref:hypothetical protein n=1 Tax=Sorangium sp. So ce291 TaxID=3133294 RepID=UPI003F5E4DEB
MMNASARPTTEEVMELAEVWYRKLDEHAPAEELLPLVDEDELQMKLPEATLHGQPAFIEWYDGVIWRFFDEVHTLKEVAATPVAGGVQVKVVVNWQAKVWSPPAAKSQWLGFDAYQTWIVKRSERTGGVVITEYVVDELRPMAGSAALP